MPAPFSTRVLPISRVRAGGRSQNLMLFIRGKVISGANIINGVSQLPNPPIMIGITRKKIIRKAWAVTSVLYNWSLPSKVPGWPSSVRIRSLIDVPKSPAHVPRMKYIVPMSLWFVDPVQRRSDNACDEYLLPK